MTDKILPADELRRLKHWLTALGYTELGLEYSPARADDAQFAARSPAPADVGNLSHGPFSPIINVVGDLSRSTSVNWFPVERKFFQRTFLKCIMLLNHLIRYIRILVLI